MFRKEALEELRKHRVDGEARAAAAKGDPAAAERARGLWSHERVARAFDAESVAAGERGRAVEQLEADGAREVVELDGGVHCVA